MLDTVKFRLSGSPFKGCDSSWEIKEGTQKEENGVREWTGYTHKESGMRVRGSDGLASTVEVSLPRLMHGCNGKLLRPNEVNTAYFAAMDLVGSVVDECSPEKLTRLDLVHHFKGMAFEYVQALKGLRHTGVRNKQVEYFESGLEWPGRNLYIRMYDKKAEMCNRPGHIQRLEAQLRNSKLDGVVWSQRSGFDVEHLYDMYKKICAGFCSRRLPKLGTLEEFLHYLKENRVIVQGVCPVDRFLAYKSRTTRYRIQKALNDVSLQFFDASFSAHLPDDINDLTFIDCLPDAQPSALVGPFQGGDALVA